MNGRSIHPLKDPWIPTLSGFKITSPNQMVDSPPTTWMKPGHDQWDPGKLRETFCEEESKEIKRIPIGPPNIKDH
ncbi:hypothetical protein LINPERPRIM_LOCUS36475 [Linum perenne]